MKRDMLGGMRRAKITAMRDAFVLYVCFDCLEKAFMPILSNSIDVVVDSTYLFDLGFLEHIYIAKGVSFVLFNFVVISAHFVGT